jgi:replicative superfamily II helicase
MLPCAWLTVSPRHGNLNQVLVFCFSRRHCEACALSLAERLPAPSSLPAATAEARRALVKDLSSKPGSLHPSLARALPAGVAFHHAGLTDDEKDAVEDAFRRGHLAVMVATSTLGAGINLPAARVIFRSVRPAAGAQLDLASFRQMAGRAGGSVVPWWPADGARV